MAITVAEAFERFSSDYVDVDPQSLATAKQSRAILMDYFSHEATKWFPPFNGDCVPYGAIDRNTAIQSTIRPLDNVGLYLVVATTPNISRAGEFGKPREVEAEPALSMYATSGNLDPRTFAEHMKSALDATSKCRDIRLKFSPCSVNFAFAEYPWRFELTPAIAIRGEGGKTKYILTPESGLKWRRSDPESDSIKLKSIDDRHNGHFLPLARILKRWNDRCSTIKLEDRYVEMLTAEVFGNEHEPTMVSVRHGVERFFVQAQSAVTSERKYDFDFARDAAEPSQEIKGRLVDEYVLRAQMATIAIDAEQTNDPSAIGRWKRLFREGFPSPH